MNLAKRLRTASFLVLPFSMVSLPAQSYEYVPDVGNCLQVFYDPSHYNWLALRNACSTPIHVTWVGKGRRGGGAADISANGKASTGLSRGEVNSYGGFVYAVCPRGYTPVDAAGRHWNRADEGFRCRR
jgi:hypothetical protein